MSHAAYGYEVYRIVASSCPNEGIQTGFSMGHGQGIITALHGVAGCNIRAEKFEDDALTGAIPSLEIALVDIDRDIALLTHRNGQTYNSVQQDLPDEQARLSVRGFPQATSLLDRTEVVLGDPGYSELRSAAGKWVEVIGDIGSPSLSIKVLRLDGDVQVGHSGAPVLNQNDSPIAVIIGGFGLGEFGKSWAIPLSEIKLSPFDEREIASIATSRAKYSSGGISTSEVLDLNWLGLGNRLEFIASKLGEPSYERQRDYFDDVSRSRKLAREVFFEYGGADIRVTVDDQDRANAIFVGLAVGSTDVALSGPGDWRLHWDNPTRSRRWSELTFQDVGSGVCEGSVNQAATQSTHWWECEFTHFKKGGDSVQRVFGCWLVAGTSDGSHGVALVENMPDLSPMDQTEIYETAKDEFDAQVQIKERFSDASFNFMLVTCNPELIY